MESHELKFVLEELHFSALLPPELLERLAAESTVRQISAGEILFREGTVDDNFYIVHTGRLAIEMSIPGRGPVRILTVGPGDMVGWSALLGQGKMTAAAVAVEDSEVVVAPAKELRGLCAENPEFGFHLMKRMADALSRRLVATRLQLLDLFADTARTVPSGGSEGQR